MFNQQYLICDWWFNVDCSLAESFYSINEEIAAEQAANSPDGDATALPTSYLPSYPDTPPTQVNTFLCSSKTNILQKVAPHVTTNITSILNIYPSNSLPSRKDLILNFLGR